MYDEVPSPNRYSSMNMMETFIKALTKPNEEAYKEIVNDPGASLGKGLLWIGVASLIGGLFTGIFNAIFGSSAFNQISQYADVDIPRAGSAIGTIFGSMFGGLFGAIFGALIFVGLVQLVAKMLGGTGTYAQLFYGYAAFQAPISLVTGLLGAIPLIGCITIPVAIYAIVLGVIANKATHEYDTGKAVISTLAPALVLFLFCCCIIAIVGAISGFAMGDVFNNLY